MKRFIIPTAILLVLFMLGTPQVTAAEKFEITPIVGFNVGRSFDVSGATDYINFEFKSNISYGLAIAYPLNQEILVEFMYTRESGTLSGTEATWGEEVNDDGGTDQVITDTTFLEITDMNINRFHLNLIYTFEESIPNIAPYTMLGVGLTHFDGEDDLDSEIRFSFSIAAGFKIFFNRNKNLGLRIQGAWSPILVKKNKELFYSDVNDGEYVQPENDLMANWEFTGGLFIRL